MVNAALTIAMGRSEKKHRLGGGVARSLQATGHRLELELRTQ
jgi:hypothetical protein